MYLSNLLLSQCLNGGWRSNGLSKQFAVNVLVNGSAGRRTSVTQDTDIVKEYSRISTGYQEDKTTTTDDHISDTSYNYTESATTSATTSAVPLLREDES